CWMRLKTHTSVAQADACSRAPMISLSRTRLASRGAKLREQEETCARHRCLICFRGRERRYSDQRWNAQDGLGNGAVCLQQDIDDLVCRSSPSRKQYFDDSDELVCRTDSDFTRSRRVRGWWAGIDLY